MPHQNLEQRIRYLVEHGGVYDDPLEDIRRSVRRLRYWAVALTVIGVGVNWLV